MMIYPLLDLPQLFVSGKQAFVNIDRLEEMKDHPTFNKDEDKGQVVRTFSGLSFEQVNCSYPEKDETIKSYEKTIYDLTVKTAASQLASKLALQGSADVLLPHIERRLQVENKEGKALIRVLDEKGNLSANSLADLEKEILSTKAFAPILQGPKSSGTGVQTEGRKTSTSGMKRSEMSAQQKAEFINEHGQAEFLKIPK